MVIKEGKDRLKTTAIEVACDCHTEKLVISRFDDELDLYFLSFYVDQFYSCQRVRTVIWDRIKMAWKALRKGNFIFHEMSFDKAKLIELRDNINEVIIDG